MNDPLSISSQPVAPADTTHEKDLLALLEGTIPGNKTKELAKGVVLAVGEKAVLLDVGLKADGVISLNEFKDDPKLGEEVEVYIEHQENRKGELVVSHKKAKLLKNWKMIEKSFSDKTTVKGKVERRVKGGLILSIHGISAFLPGSHIDLSSVTDFDAYIGKILEVLVLNINYEKGNVIVSRRAVLEYQQKDLIESLEEGQILQGTVKNITNFGVFVELATGIIGLVYIKEASWDKKIAHPDQVKKEDGAPLFVLGESVEVIVKGFETKSNSLLPRISLSTKELLTNPWDDLPENLVEGAVVTEKVKELKKRGAIVEVIDGIVGFLHVSDMSHSSYLQDPERLIKEGEELTLQVLSINSEEQELRLGMKQLIPNPWEASDFLEKYGLNTVHQATVKKYGDRGKGAYLELALGVEGYIENDHISWTEKILQVESTLRLEETYEVIVIGLDEEKRLLKLGMRELKESPWTSFEEILIEGSEHEGVVKKKYKTGAIIELSCSLQVFVFNRGLTKKDDTPVKEGDTLPFKIIEFVRYEQKIVLSHAATWQQLSHEQKKYISAPIEKSRLSDLVSLSELKKKLINSEEEKKKKNK